MKKIISILLVVFLLIGCASSKRDLKKENVNNISKEDQVKEKIVPIGLYNKVGEQRQLVSIYQTEWIKNQDLLVFSTFATKENVISGDSFQDVFTSYWNFDTSSQCKIGYMITFTLQDGRYIQKNILQPEDAQDIYSYLQVYLYDDVHQKKGAFYTHIEKVEEDTLLTSIKLTGSTQVDEIVSPIYLTAFIYENENDFDSHGMYKGKSLYKTEIQKIV